MYSFLYFKHIAVCILRREKGNIARRKRIISEGEQGSTEYKVRSLTHEQFACGMPHAHYL